MLTHARAVAMLQCFPGKVLRFVDRRKGFQAMGQQSGNTGCEGATGAMINMRQAFPGKCFQPPVSTSGKMICRSAGRAGAWDRTP